MVSLKDDLNIIKGKVKNVQHSKAVNKGKEFIIKHKNKKNLLIVLFIFITIVVGCFIYIVYKYSKMNVNRVKFFKSVVDTTVKKIIPKHKIVSKVFGEKYSFSMWFKIDNWYATGNDTPELWNHVFTFGSSEILDGIPSVYLSNKLNNMKITVKTSYLTNCGQNTGVCPSNYEDILVKTVPLKKWFKLTVVMKAKSVQVYINSKLDVYSLFTGNIALPQDGIILFDSSKSFYNSNGQLQKVSSGESQIIDGYFSNFTFYNIALSPSQVAHLYDIGDKPTKQSLIYRLINFFINIGKYGYDNQLKDSS